MFVEIFVLFITFRIVTLMQLHLYYTCIQFKQKIVVNGLSS